ncbi:tetratricopeptide repeat protein [Arenibacter latericius]|uniref:tetratricopeptide repeat protein n=1 Tax=Arenibacter latericius TaxID=86104 RepID=UPI00047BA263|nr:tetratricopeptide repeat protein [Arenibacter latericius]MDX1364873.1 tetratricopeptide repeat protein [Arenibacter latericius]
MKTNILILSTMFCSVVGFSQKSEIRTADRALRSGNAAEAKAALESASSLIDGANDKMQAEYYLLKGKAYSELAKKGEADAFDVAIASLRKVGEVEKANGRSKYTSEANEKLAGMTVDLVNAAVEDNNNERFKEGAEKLYLGYQLSPKDTVYLYYAASSAVNGGHFEQALEYYNELKELNYDGSGIVYKATNVETGEVEEMDKTQRELMVKSGAYKDPVDEKTPSKTTEIVKNVALIYTQLGQDDKALEAYKDARAKDPKDVNLILNEANLYYKMGDKEKFKSLMAEATEVAPDNPDLFYNIGVINMEQGNIEEARAAYKRAIEINPKYVNAQLNLSTTYVNEGNSLIDEMNSLGNSKKDIARYDELKEQKDSLFRDGAIILEDAIKESPDNQGILTQLKNIYGALGDNENFMRVKKLLGE